MKDFIINRLDCDDGSRFYQAVEKDGKILWAYPSVTHVLDKTYPMDSYLIKWIRENGIAGQFEFQKAADRGTEVHVAIENLLHGDKVSTVDMEKRVAKGIQSFIDWYNETKPKILQSEEIVYNHEHRYAGGLDLLCEIGGVKYVVDFKTSNSVQDKHKIQVAAYHATIKEEGVKTAILHLGNRTKKGYSFLEYDPQPYWEQFVHLRKGYDLLYPKAEPKITDYPDYFEL